MTSFRGSRKADTQSALEGGDADAYKSDPSKSVLTTILPLAGNLLRTIKAVGSIHLR